ncbi:hypothetical protein SY88_12545 [Clostridiales bacterium PH28_bin88]|nr:hypothetical protein SY88_12545 [Clostridiales bacterium PH28_bin88]
MDLRECQEVADARATEASCLFTGNYCHGAIYLIGYSVEVLLKALLLKRYGNFPNIHDLIELFQKNGINSHFYAQEKWENEFVNLRREVEMRYRANDFSNWHYDDVAQLYRAAGRLVKKLKGRLL